MPEPAVKEQRSKGRKEDSAVDELIKEYPWLIHLDSAEGFAAERKALAQKGMADGEDEAAAELTEEVMALMAVTAMEAARVTCAGVAPERGSDFISNVLGDTPKNRLEAKPADAIQGVCSGGLADDFCRRRKVQVSFRAGFGRHGSVEDCGILVRAWCDRMQYLFDTEMSSGDLDFKFSAADIASYEEPVEFRSLADRAAPGDETMKRVMQIRNISPL